MSELAELFGVTRQAMNKRVKQLDEKFVEKNDRNVTVVNADGIHELENLYGKIVTAEAEVIDEKPEETTALETTKQFDTATFELLSNLMKDKNTEIERLTQQLQTKDVQLAEKDKQIFKQQEIMEKTLADNNQFLLELKENQKKGFFARIFGK